SAVQTMAESVMQDDIVMIEFKKSKLLFEKNDKITVVTKISPNQQVNAAKTAIKNVSKKFLSDFGEGLEDWFGNTLVFNNFEEKISKYMIPKKKT
ncbi:MAG: hypothetical protein ACTSWY_14675, partial [Promethearchaeota archaeon]